VASGPLRCRYCGEPIGREEFVLLTVLEDGRRGPAVAHKRCTPVENPSCAVSIEAPTRSGSCPIFSPASLSAIRAAATANCAKRSILRIVLRSSQRSGSKSAASQAIRTEWPEVAKAVIGPPPPSPATSRRQVVSISGPSGETAPNPSHDNAPLTAHQNLIPRGPGPKRPSSTRRRLEGRRRVSSGAAQCFPSVLRGRRRRRRRDRDGSGVSRRFASSHVKSKRRVGVRHQRGISRYPKHPAVHAEHEVIQ
jgi:hypothetical protein